jgi:hypothetical protein
MPVRVLHRHASLARTPQPVQDHDPRPAAITARQPQAHVSEQLLPTGQERWPGQQPHRLAQYHRRAVRPGQRRHLIGQLGKRSFDALALQVGHVMIQLVRKRCQWPATRPAPHDLPHEVISQHLSQHAARNSQQLGRRPPGTGQSPVIQDSQLGGDSRLQRLQQRHLPRQRRAWHRLAEDLADHHRQLLSLLTT